MTKLPPFYARPGNEPTWNIFWKIASVIGFWQVCGRSACRRGGRCGATCRRDLPPCIWEYRGVVRYFTELVRTSGIADRMLAEMPEEDDAPADMTPRLGRPGRQGDLPLLAFLRSRCLAGNPRAEWVWEDDPEALALRARIRLAREKGG